MIKFNPKDNTTQFISGSPSIDSSIGKTNAFENAQTSSSTGRQFSKGDQTVINYNSNNKNLIESIEREMEIHTNKRDALMAKFNETKIQMNMYLISQEEIKSSAEIPLPLEFHTEHTMQINELNKKLHEIIASMEDCDESEHAALKLQFDNIKTAMHQQLEQEVKNERSTQKEVQIAHAAKVKYFNDELAELIQSIDDCNLKIDTLQIKREPHVRERIREVEMMISAYDDRTQAYKIERQQLLSKLKQPGESAVVV